MFIRGLQNESAALKRGLGLLLIVFVLYGTTVEAAHRHGRILSAGSENASVVDSEPGATLVGSKTGCSDCLICQLHQNLTITLTIYRLNDSQDQTRSKFTPAVQPTVLSQRAGPAPGRAPPSIS